MYKKLIMGIALLLSFSLAEALDCGPNVPNLPHVFYGYAKYDGNILEDKTIIATLGGNEFSTTTDSNGYYYLAVARCSNDSSTTVTFNVCIRTATETATYFEGGVSNLNLTISSDCGYSLNLNAGWNMISLPLVPENNTVEEIFGDCISTLDIKPVVRWQSPMFLIAEELYPKEGYWLFSPTSTTCNITGLEIDDNTLSLVAGWNMVGTTSETNDLNISLIPNQVEMRPAVTWQFPLFVETTNIEPGKSAWVFVTQNTEVEI